MTPLKPTPKSYLAVTHSGYEFRHAQITIQHPLGLFMCFPANHHRAVALVEFGQQCSRDLENQYAQDDWSI